MPVAHCGFGGGSRRPGEVHQNAPAIVPGILFRSWRRICVCRRQSFPEFCFALGEGYAFVGALWLAASRTGMQLFGFREPIVLLTAIHFHYA